MVTVSVSTVWANPSYFSCFEIKYIGTAYSYHTIRISLYRDVSQIIWPLERLNERTTQRSADPTNRMENTQSLN